MEAFLGGWVGGGGGGSIVAGQGIEGVVGWSIGVQCMAK